MIDSKSVVQEVQKELLAVMQRGQEQVRKGQDRVRKSQEQARKSRDAVVSVVRAGSELAKAARPSAPTLPTLHIPSPATVRAHAEELAGQAISAQRELATKARHAASPYAEHVATAQRALAGRVSGVAKVATPIVAEGVTRLTQLVGALQPGHSAAGAAKETAREATSAPTATAAPGAAKVSQPAGPEVQTPAKAKARTGRASTAKDSTTKASTTKASTAKASTTKASTTKASTTKASARPRASKPRNTEK